MASSNAEDPEVSGLLRTFRSLAERWPFVNLGLMVSPPVTCSFSEMSGMLPRFPTSLFEQGMGKGTLGVRSPIIMASTHLVLQALENAHFKESADCIDAGRKHHVITKISGKDENSPPRLCFRACYFPVYDLRGISGDTLFAATQLMEVRQAWAVFEAACREVCRLFRFEGCPRMGGLTGGGELHDGAGTPPEWRDAIKWMNWLFRDQRDEELYETFPGEPWLLSCLSPNLGEASATALECSGLECLGPPPPAYLGIVLGDRTASRAVDGEERTAEFGRKLKPWDMFRRLLECGPDGMLKAELQKVLDMESRDEAALRGHKGTVNTIVECLRVEIDADGRGVWRIKEL